MSDLHLVAGLGNPGPQYIGTRHNVGFMAIDRLAEKKGVTLSRSAAWNSDWGKWGDTLLIKPLSYMNRSGDVVGRFARYFKIQPEEILVVVDDVALPLGRLRLRPSGSDGGHNGLKSIIEHLGQTFMRLENWDRSFSGSRRACRPCPGKIRTIRKPTVDNALERATEAIEHLADKGMASAMSNYNRAE